MSFDPTRIDEDHCAQGHLDEVPIYDILRSVSEAQVTGRLTIEDAAGANHMYFMRGQPVGVELAELVHPLGQLLLELGRINGAVFVKAQRLISEGQRLPGQVFKELGVLDEGSLKEVLTIQARKKAEHFCRFGGRAFVFCRGLSYLTGFNSTPLNIHAVIFLALQKQMGPASRTEWLESARDQEVSAPGFGEMPLPAPTAVYGFGPPEERFLLRLAAGFEPLERLAETGTLPADEMAVLLRYLQLMGRLQMRPVAPRPAAPPSPPSPSSPANPALTPSTEEDVFSTSSQDVPAPAPERRPPSAPAFRSLMDPVSGEAPSSPPRTPPPPASEAKPAPMRVESLLHRPKAPAPPPLPRPAAPKPAPAPAPAPAERGEGVSFPSEGTLDEVPRKKKKGRRIEPEPSMGSSAVSVVRKEKTLVAPLPSIVIEGLDEEG